MISIPVSHRIDSGTPPYTYAWSSTIDCVTFNNPTGFTYNNIIEEVINFENEECLLDTTIQLTVVDINSCEGIITVVIPNICEDLILNNINSTGVLTFSVLGSNSRCSQLSLLWNYDTSLFDLISTSGSNFSSTLKLKYKSNLSSYPATTPITVSTTDCNNCFKSVSYIHEICQPIAQDVIVQMSTLVNNQFESSIIQFPSPTSCPYNTIDWATILLDLPTGTTYEYLGDNKFKFYGLSSILPGALQGLYSVKVDTGIKSTSANVTFLFSTPNNNKTITVPNKTIVLECSVSAGSTIEINIEDELVLTPGTIVDWSSFSVIEPPVSSSPSIDLSTNLDGDHIIEYELLNPIESDAFAWKICDTNGNCTNAIFYTIVECSPAPTAIADAAVCICGETINVDVLANDSGGSSAIDNTSVVIVSGPANGFASVSTTGEIIYTAPSNYSGSVVISYNFKNVHGIVSSNANLTITVICAGQDTAITVCNN